MTVQILTGDCREILKTLPDGSVNMVLTSPPYFGQRDYETGSWQGGDPDCKHIRKKSGNGKATIEGSDYHSREVQRSTCRLCGAERVDRQIGLETEPEAFIAELVAVFREVRRVLTKNGTCWIVIGDSYAAGGRGGGGKFMAERGDGAWKGQSEVCGWRRPAKGLKRKDLIGIPWMLAFALRADGWYLRQEIIWDKPNAPPESATDRCTKAHESIFLLTKSQKYHFDNKAIQEPVSADTPARYDRGRSNGHKWADGGPGGQTIARGYGHMKRRGNKARKAASERGVPVDDDGRTTGAVAHSIPWEGSTRNKRSVWRVPTAQFSERHFATFPPDLIEPCILAGCPAGGVVLDPFFGAGTTGLVAARLGRNCIGIDLSPQYVKMARNRIKRALAKVECDQPEEIDHGPLFGGLEILA